MTRRTGRGSHLDLNQSGERTHGASASGTTHIPGLSSVRRPRNGVCTVSHNDGNHHTVDLTVTDVPDTATGVTATITVSGTFDSGTTALVGGDADANNTYRLSPW